MQCDGKNYHSNPGLLNTNIQTVQTLAKKLLDDIGVKTSHLDVQLILAHVLDTSRLQIQLERNNSLTAVQHEYFWRLLQRRLCFEPVAYLLNTKEFFGLHFFVSKDCLIPRPDTEVIVEKCLELIDQHSITSVYDLCTGSGAIALSILHERAHVHVEACDISEQALNIARLNADNLGVSNRLKLHHGDLFAPFSLRKKPQLIVANPPYIDSKVLPLLCPDVREHEPHIALDGGEQGMDVYKRLMKEALIFLPSQGFLVLEIGFDQADKIKDLIDPSVGCYEFFKDLAGYDRGVVLQKK